MLWVLSSTFDRRVLESSGVYVFTSNIVYYRLQVQTLRDVKRCREFCSQLLAYYQILARVLSSISDMSVLSSSGIDVFTSNVVCCRLHRQTERAPTQVLRDVREWLSNFCLLLIS